MGLPAAGILGNPAVLEPAYQTAIEDFLKFVRAMPGGAIPLDVTLDTNGDFTVGLENGLYLVDGNGAAADDLDNILQTNTQDGQVIGIRCKDAARAITVKHNAGGTGLILLADQADLVLDDTDHWLFLRRSGTTWVEMHRTQWWTLSAPVQVFTNGSGSPLILGLKDFGKTFSNEGAGAQAYLTLPAATKVGGRIRLWVDDADGMRVVPAGTDQIRKGASLTTASTGYIHTTTQGIFAELVVVKTGLWALSEDGGTFTFV